MTDQPTTDPTDGLTYQQIDALWDAVAIPGPTEPTFPMQHERVCRAVAEILAELTPAPPAVPVSSPPPDQTAEELATARATNRRLNLRAQALESELAAYRRAVAQWKISETGTYVPLRTLAVIAKVAGLDVPDRWELHYERVERAEAELRRLAAEAQQTTSVAASGARTNENAASLAASPSNRRALVHNAISDALSAAGDRVPFSVRAAATRAALAEVDGWQSGDTETRP